MLEFTYVFLWLETCFSQLRRYRCELAPEHEIRGNSGESRYEPALGGGGEGQRTDAIALPRKLAWASPYRRLFTASGQATKLEGLSATGAPRSSAGRRGRKRAQWDVRIDCRPGDEGRATTTYITLRVQERDIQAAATHAEPISSVRDAFLSLATSLRHPRATPDGPLAVFDGRLALGQRRQDVGVPSAVQPERLVQH